MRVETTDKDFCFMVKLSLINPQALVAEKNVDELVFRRFQGEEVEFFLNLTDSDF